MFLWEIERRLKTWTFDIEGHVMWDVLIFFLLSVALTWPIVINISDAALGSQHADGMKHLWTLWWMRASVWDHGQFPFHTDLINYPTGMDLYPIEPLNGLIVNLLPFLSIITVSNILVLMTLFSRIRFVLSNIANVVKNIWVFLPFLRQKDAFNV